MSFHSSLIPDIGTDSHAFLKSIDRLLHRKPDKRLPFCSSSGELANRSAAFFKGKIDALHSEHPEVDVPHFLLRLILLR